MKEAKISNPDVWQFLKTNPTVNIPVGTALCSATMFTFPFDNFNVNKLHSGILCY